MTQLSKDARDFVDNVARFVSGDGQSRSANLKVRSLLSKVSGDDKKQNTATVESSVPLSTDETSSIGTFVEKLVGHPVQLDNRVRPEIIGGLRITIGDWILDTTLSKQLDDLVSVLA